MNEKLSFIRFSKPRLLSRMSGLLIIFISAQTTLLKASLVCETLQDQLKGWQSKLGPESKQRTVQQVKEAIKEQLAEAQKKLHSLQEESGSIERKQQDLVKEIESLENQKKEIHPEIIPDTIKFKSTDLPKLRTEKEQIILNYNKLHAQNPQLAADKVAESKIKEIESDLVLSDQQLLEKAQKELEFHYQQIQIKQIEEIDNKIKKIQQELQSQKQALLAVTPEKNKHDIDIAQNQIDYLQKRLNRSDDEILNEQKKFIDEQIQSVQKDISSKCK